MRSVARAALLGVLAAGRTALSQATDDPSTVTDAPCVWPNCTTTCGYCTRSNQFSASCLLDLPLVEECPVAAECWLGKCVCKPGFCQEHLLCMPQLCTTGATPPAFYPNTFVYQLAQFGPPAPGRDSPRWMWGVYSLLALGSPIALGCTGGAIAWSTKRLIEHPPDWWMCRTAPRVPIFLPLWAGLTLTTVFVNWWARQQAVAETLLKSHVQLHELKQDLKKVLDLATKLSERVADFKQHLNDIPESCALSQVTKPVMKKLVSAVDGSSAHIYASVDRVHHTIELLPGEINGALGMQIWVEFLVLVIPFLPSMIEMLSTVVIVVVALLAFFSPKPQIAERAIRALTRFGARGFASLIVLAGVMAGLYLEVGIVASRMCLDVDENVMGIVSNIDFSAEAHDKNNQTTEDVNGAAQFYVAGRGYNPLEEAVRIIQSNVDTLSDARNSTRWIEDVAGAFCPALHDFNAEHVRGKATKAIKTMLELLAARNLWPYYKVVVHDIACTKLPEHVHHLVLCNIMIGFVMIPVLAITFQVDLKRMLAYKTDANFADEEEEEDDEDESDDSVAFLHVPFQHGAPRDALVAPAPACMSAPTYTHKTKTTAKGAGDGGRTFLA